MPNLLRGNLGKRDATERPIIDALRGVGCTVIQLSQAGVPDLLVSTPRGETFLLEVKTTPKHKLTPDEIAFFDAWQGDNLFMVVTVEEALRACGF